MTNLNQKRMKKDRRWIFPTIVIGFLLIFSAIMIPLMAKDKKETKIFYEEWCPKLGAEILQPREGYNYNGRCIIVEDGIVRLFFIAEINGEYMLREIIQK